MTIIISCCADGQADKSDTHTHKHTDRERDEQTQSDRQTPAVVVAERQRWHLWLDVVRKMQVACRPVTAIHK